MPNGRTKPVGTDALVTVSFVVFLALALALASLLVASHGLDEALHQALLIAFVLSFAGLGGGLLYGLQSGSIALPHRKSNSAYSLGFIADCLYGVAGSFAIFLIVPGDFDLTQAWTWVKVAGLGIIGGYGGRGVIDRALAQAFKDLERKVDQTEIERDASAEALRLATRQLTDEIPQVDEKALATAIRNASPATVIELLHRARKFRRDHVGKGAAIARTVPILRAIAERPDQEKFHRPYAQLAYALKESTPPDCAAAIEQLTKAIEIRDRTSGDEGFYKYELARAECRIALDPHFNDREPTPEPLRSQILDDIASARRRAGRAPFELTSRTILLWLERNEPSLLRKLETAMAT